MSIYCAKCKHKQECILDGNILHEPDKYCLDYYEEVE